MTTLEIVLFAVIAGLVALLIWRGSQWAESIVTLRHERNNANDRLEALSAMHRARCEHDDALIAKLSEVRDYYAHESTWAATAPGKNSPAFKDRGAAARKVLEEARV